MIYTIKNTDGEQLQVTDEPRFVKISDTNGCYVQCPQGEATHIAIKGETYKLKDVEIIRQSFENYIVTKEAQLDYLSMMTGVDIDVVEDTDDTDASTIEEMMVRMNTEEDN